MSGNNISIRVLDLNQEWESIKNKLNSIAESVFDFV